MDSCVEDQLRAVAWRMRVAVVARRVLVAWLVLAGGGLVLGSARMAGGAPPFTVEIGGLLLGLTVIVGLVALVGSRVEVGAAARRIDGAVGGSDLLVTAAALGVCGGWEGLVTRDALAAMRRLPASGAVDWRWGRLVGWALIPVVVGAVMGLAFRSAADATAKERATAAEVLAEAADVVAAGGVEDLKETEAALRESAAELREKLVDVPNEQALRALAQASADVDRLSGERAADGSEGEGGREGKAGDLSASPVEGLPRGEELAAGDGRRLSEAELRQMAERLEEMKRALRQPGGGASPGASSGDGESLARMEAAMGAGREVASPGESGSELPGGGPGSDRDVGAGGELFGDKADVDVTGLDDRAGLDSGAGAAVVVGTVSVDGPGKANAEYRAAYGAAVRAAEGAVQREELPYGSRELVRRYFERIKPE